MNRYKLVNDYPGRSLGDVAIYNPEKCVDNFVWESDGKAIPRDFQPDVTLTWFELIKDFEILQLRKSGEDSYILTYEGEVCVYRNDGVGVKNTLKKSDALYTGVVEIYSVKRLSDGVVFTVGDKVLCNGVYRDTIESIRFFQRDYLQFNFVGDTYFTTESEWEKMVKRNFILTTEDGVDVYDGDSYTFMWTDRPAHGQVINKLYDVKVAYLQADAEPSEHAIFFSTREIAEKYLEEKLPLITTMDGMPLLKGDLGKTSVAWVINGNYAYDLKFSEGHAKLLNYNPEVYKIFSTSDKAIQWVKSQTPLFTTEDRVKIFEGDNWWYVAHNKMVARQTNTLNYLGTNESCVSRFSTKEAAERWIKENRKPLFTTNDKVDVYEGGYAYVIDEDFIVRHIKVWSKGNWKAAFKDHSKADEYVFYNKPVYSFLDVQKVYSTATLKKSYKGNFNKYTQALVRMFLKKNPQIKIG